MHNLTRMTITVRLKYQNNDGLTQLFTVAFPLNAHWRRLIDLKTTGFIQPPSGKPVMEFHINFRTFWDVTLKLEIMPQYH